MSSKIPILFPAFAKVGAVMLYRAVLLVSSSRLRKGSDVILLFIQTGVIATSHNSDSGIARSVWRANGRAFNNGGNLKLRFSIPCWPLCLPGANSLVPGVM